MKPINPLVLLVLLLLTASCNTESKKITDATDYNFYLEITENEMLQLVKEDLKFWEKKYEKDPNQFPYLSKIAASQSQIFAKTGRIEALIEAEKNLIEANELSHYKKVGYLRALSRNYISQHRFKEALQLLEKAETIGEGVISTQKMLFDVHLELGNYQLAKQYLNEIIDTSDFDYLIRLSKWSDHRGNLDAAIKYMEQAKVIAEASNIPSIKQWVYTNLADYYGHAGNVKASYNHYLKALELNPEDAYAKKGIAWIVYSYEKNPDEALRILNAVTKTHHAPDYHLLKAEIAEYKGDSNLKDTQLKLYKVALNNNMYGAMYNKHNALIYAEDSKQTVKALKLANTEINNRPTPQSYDLLAWTYYNQGDVKDALKIMENHVVGKTFEPEALFHLAHIYKANGKWDEVKKLKKELLESAFELGPMAAQKVQKL
ncbi:tetratricopeptide repeat protein [Hwangdonia sp.]|uniref:tetratricopeptide repeat protein n=1 Tax=Hwangdonia sp. TaxID=1883432 RepID=UPI003AB54747